MTIDARQRERDQLRVLIVNAFTSHGARITVKQVDKLINVLVGRRLTDPADVSTIVLGYLVATGAVYE